MPGKQLALTSLAVAVRAYIGVTPKGQVRPRLATADRTACITAGTANQPNRSIHRVSICQPKGRAPHGPSWGSITCSALAHRRTHAHGEEPSRLDGPCALRCAVFLPFTCFSLCYRYHFFGQTLQGDDVVRASPLRSYSNKRANQMFYLHSSDIFYKKISSCPAHCIAQLAKSGKVLEQHKNLLL
jgi:hypothetical protein